MAIITPDVETSMLDEQQLIKNLQTGDQSAFKLLIDQQQEKVLNTCLGFVRNQHDAEDLTQEVFVEVYRSIANFRKESKLSSWIYRIAVSKSLEYLRAKKRKKRFAFFQSLIGLNDQIEHIAAGESHHPGLRLEDKERAKILFAAIDQLAENQKVAFTLHKVEGLSYKEIADIMEVSLSSIESLMFRAKKNLKKRLYHYYKKNII